MHGGWYAGGMGALGASNLQGGFSSSGLGGGVVPHSQSYHLMVSIRWFARQLNIFLGIETNQYFSFFSNSKCRAQHGVVIMRDGLIMMPTVALTSEYWCFNLNGTNLYKKKTNKMSNVSPPPSTTTNECQQMSRLCCKIVIFSSIQFEILWIAAVKHLYLTLLFRMFILNSQIYPKPENKIETQSDLIMCK